MSGPIYGRNRRDKSEPGIIDAFEEGGASVTPLDKPLDLLVGFLGAIHLVECKSDNEGYTEAQMRFLATWKGEAPVDCRTPAQAKKWLAVWAEEARPAKTSRKALRVAQEPAKCCGGCGVAGCGENAADGEPGGQR